MNIQTVVLTIAVVGVLALVGLFNYRAAMKRGKEMFCDVNCKDGAACDFLMKDLK